MIEGEKRGNCGVTSGERREADIVESKLDSLCLCLSLSFTPTPQSVYKRDCFSGVESKEGGKKEPSPFLGGADLPQTRGTGTVSPDCQADRIYSRLGDTPLGDCVKCLGWVY